MKQPSTNFFAARRGTTLIEVITALVILGTILSSMLVARNRFVRQDALATRKLQAIHALDSMAADWMNGPPSAIPTHDRGPLADLPDCYWQTSAISQPSAAMVKAKVVRVEVLQAASRSPLATLDLLVPSDPTAEARP